MKKAEKEAKEKLRRHQAIYDVDHVAIVTRRGTRMEYNQGQSVKQGFGSGLKDIKNALKKKK